MSKHWIPNSDVRQDLGRRRPQDAPAFVDNKLMLLCAAALFGVAVAIVESLLP